MKFCEVFAILPPRLVCLYCTGDLFVGDEASLVEFVLSMCESAVSVLEFVSM